MSGYKLYSRLSDKETILELWGGSTKHPDSVFFFSKFKLSEYFKSEDQILPWVLECASKMTFPVHSFEIGRWICGMYAEGRGL